VKIKTIAQEFVGADITGGYGGDPMRIANGSPILTSNFLDGIVGAIRHMEMELDSDFDLTLWFSQTGVQVTGETKT